MSTSPQLKTGIYTIVNKHTGQAVGRARAEDRSALPRRIVALPAGATNDEGSQWVIKAKDGKYELSVLGASTFAQDQLVFGDLFGDQVEQWKIEAQTHLGENTYTIVQSFGIGGWVLEGDDATTQVACRGLIVGHSHPPFFPANQLWVITPVAA
ncbi:Serine protease inhibitor [Hypsizygus marmoreus]|uniref:Serine protease inhibitor n=1 Tax=Hypsizygus marmoreus TaxID=39966 RepID=A0A369JVR9_HYPMA|nr:Serine protease inhibitor [Hypsizygus marmoreus]